MAAAKRISVPGEVDKLVAHQSRLLKAPRIAGHYDRHAEQGRAAGWSLEDYLAAVLAVESNARAESGARQTRRRRGLILQGNSIFPIDDHLVGDGAGRRQNPLGPVRRHKEE